MYADVSPFSNRPPYFRYRTRSCNPRWSHLTLLGRRGPPAKCTDGACWVPGISMTRLEKFKLVIVYFIYIIYIYSLRLDMFFWHHLTIDHLTIKTINSCLHQINNPRQNKVRQHSSRNNKNTPQQTMPTGFWQDLLFSVPLCFSPGFFFSPDFLNLTSKIWMQKDNPSKGAALNHVGTTIKDFYPPQ